MGILLKAGARRCRNESTKEMRSSDTSKRRSFLPQLCQEIDLTNYQCCFDRAVRKEQDKLAAIREIWGMFVRIYIKAFEPYEHVTVDEQLVSFRGKCPFRQYKSKPGPYGIKILAAADVKTKYLCNFQVYTGKMVVVK